MTKVRAFLVHLTISATVVGAFLALTFFFWYPEPYFEVDGAQSVIGLLAGVDVVLGPLLTLIVFKSGKPHLKLDLSIIAAIQLTAFIYGAHVIITERPGYLVYAIDQFAVIPFDKVDIAKSPYAAELEPGFWNGPTLVYGRFQREDESSEVLLKRMLEGALTDASYYEPYAHGVEAVLSTAKPVELLSEKSEAKAKAIDRFAAAHGYQADSLKYLELVGKNKAMTMFVDAKTGIPVGAIDLSSR